MLAFINDAGILIAVIVIVLLFGASQIPKLARNLGEAGREFRKAHAEAESAEAHLPPPPTALPPAAAPAPAAAEESITLTPAQLGKLLADREARARAGAPAVEPASNGAVAYSHPETAARQDWTATPPNPPAG
jgi:sec-independent protein translocase protein TatA